VTSIRASPRFDMNACENTASRATGGLPARVPLAACPPVRITSIKHRRASRQWHTSGQRGGLVVRGDDQAAVGCRFGPRQQASAGTAGSVGGSEITRKPVNRQDAERAKKKQPRMNANQRE